MDKLIFLYEKLKELSPCATAYFSNQQLPEETWTIQILTTKKKKGPSTLSDEQFGW